MSRDREGLPVVPTDPDAELIERYLAGSLSTSKARAVEKRLRSDRAFQTQAIARATLWSLGANVEAKSIEGVFDAFEAEVAGPRAQEPAGWWSRARKFAAAAAVPIVVRLATGFAALSVTIASYETFKFRRPPMWVTVTASADSTAIQSAIVDGRLAVPADSVARRFDLPNGLGVVLQPGSVFSYRTVISGGYIARYSGIREMSIEVRRPAVTVTVFTGSGRVALKRGRYGIRVSADSSETELTVIEGGAAAYGASTGPRSLLPRRVGAGERALIRVGERPTIVPTPAASPPRP